MQVGEFFWGDQTMKPNGLSIGKECFDHEIEKEKNFSLFFYVFIVGRFILFIGSSIYF